ncbi:MAG TPA: Fur family transcriptional regulator [Candidatus Dormibacteraeota bacterium]|jgi:Fur family ferric uptake transcriptional regulator
MTASAPIHAAGRTPRRLTAQRQLVAQALRDTGRTVGAVELFDNLRREHPHLGRATVFRTLDLLVEMGLAKRFEGDGHVYLYTSCEPVHHHHLVCRTCGSTTDIDDAEVDALIYSMRRRHDFVLDHGSLDFYGTCARCSSGR